MPEVRLVGLTKRYGEIIANDKVNFTIRDGEYVSVIGPSGCGKTTLIKNIAGIIQPDEGEIFIDGELVNKIPIEDRGIGYVFQNIALFPHMNVWDNLTFGSQVRGFVPNETRPLALEMLEMIKLTTGTDAYPEELSGGTRQKIAVARALISRAKLLLLDEPLGALDLKVRDKLRYELRRLVKDLKLTALHVTHDQEEAMSISDRVIVMKKGQIVEAGFPMRLYNRPKNIFTANFVGEANFLKGVVTEASRDSSSVDVGDGVKLVVKSGKETVGERVILSFRPEFVVFGSKRGINKLVGEVVDVLYSGGITRVRVRLDNGDLVVAKKATGIDEHTYSVGKEVKINVVPEAILVYSYPEEGLQRELALE
ncbi:MAG: ABC transporter ATP-binding protein [Candidatus Bathyarchaeota archaeon]|nr:ABC transporter ATP-binding protein [Candidatus Bathyarchaeota archaeon]